MKVILKKTGEIKEVAFGYAVNYLLPRGLAVEATPEEIEKIRIKNQESRIKEKEKEKKERDLARKFEGEEFVIKKKAGKKGKLFGAITKKELAKKLAVEKKAISLEKPIKKVGDYRVELKFGDKRVRVKVKVEGEK